MGISSKKKGARSVFLKTLLFQLSGRGNPQNDATPNFILDFNSCILGLSNEVSFVSGYYLEGGQNSQNVLLKILLYVYTCRSVYDKMIFITILERQPWGEKQCYPIF